MAKRVFFSFHYQDVIDFRANVVRNHWITKPDREQAGYFDASIWEEARKKGDIALKRLINGGLTNTSTTCVLVGSQTYLRPWVRYEILKSFKKGNHIFGVHINSIKGKDGFTKELGKNPFDYLAVDWSESGKTVTLLEWKNGKWSHYTQIDGSASYRLQNPAPVEYRGKRTQLSHLKNLYDWGEDDGYNNFSDWANG
ncbi:TIR domain-containing protein [Vibrio parahaemolyticus]|uniref:TIR domain-containing protein n=1 Tax=Vibrio parahaemolyticus TaxID=670 RepID=UPI00084A3FA5|nr:TIR domain-containing protein [Vibrio parahaemolyticus]ODZ60724.1 hypothetical protein BBM44_15415 [Vibrio parahaemolyticus]